MLTKELYLVDNKIAQAYNNDVSSIKCRNEVRGL